MLNFSLYTLRSWAYMLTLSLCLGAGHAQQRKLSMAHDRYGRMTLAGDIFSFTLPMIGILDHLHQAQDHPLNRTKIFIAAGGVIQGTDLIKRFFRNTSLGKRPNGYHSSFPSAHSCNAFYGARLIHKSFGLEYGAPAYAFATLTAYSRVQGHYHHVHDVVAGAVLAFTIDYLVDKIFETQFISSMAPSSFYSDGTQIGLRWSWDI